jgi:uncharacterized protein (UPF0332 family)
MSHKPDLIRYWWEKAERSVISAKTEHQLGANDFAANRLYYAAFYAVSAWLIENNYHFKKHSGARGLFHKEMVNQGLVPVKWAKFYDQLFQDRSDGDYTPMTEFEDSYIATQIKLCEEFLTHLKPLLKIFQ